tara:strand:- start:1002 stop:1220 length:219 start_codon:yes stop_codon:yes gene_type:complete
MVQIVVWSLAVCAAVGIALSAPAFLPDIVVAFQNSDTLSRPAAVGTARSEPADRVCCVVAAGFAPASPERQR